MNLKWFPLEPQAKQQYAKLGTLTCETTDKYRVVSDSTLTFETHIYSVVKIAFSKCASLLK